MIGLVAVDMAARWVEKSGFGKERDGSFEKEKKGN